MALTIDSQPTTFSVHTAYAPIVYELTSTTSGITRVIANVIDVRDSDNILASIDRDPELGTVDTFIFNIEEMAQNAMGVDVPTYDSGAQFDPINSSKQFRVEFYEVLEGSTGLLETNWTEDGSAVADAISDETTVHNAAFPFEERLSLNWSDYNNNTTNGEKKFMTDQPEVIDISLTDNAFLAVSSSIGLANDKYLRVQTFDSNDTLLETGYISMDLQQSKEGAMIGVGPENINNATFADGTATIDSSVAYYEVRFMHFSSIYRNLSRVMRYNITDYCEKQEVRFFWMNKFGKIDSYTFDSKKVSTQTIERDTYLKSLSNSPVISDRGRTTLSTNSNEEFSAFTRHLSRSKMNWLRQLQKSPFVYIDNGSGFMAVQLLDFNFTYDDTENNVSQLEIEYVFANQDEIQKG
jgi:hypothetical protein